MSQDSDLFVGSVEQLVLLVFDGPDQLSELLQGSGDPDLVIRLKKEQEFQGREWNSGSHNQTITFNFFSTKLTKQVNRTQ